MNSRRRALLRALALAGLVAWVVAAGLVVIYGAGPARYPWPVAVPGPVNPVADQPGQSPHVALPPAATTAPSGQVASGPTSAAPLPQPTAAVGPYSEPTEFRLPTAVSAIDIVAGPSVPDSARIEGVIGHRQSLPLSCESQSAADWAAFFGISIAEREFLASLPTSDDPDRGFVGSVYGTWGQLPPADYGVHAPPVAHRLVEYGVPAQAQRYFEWDQVRAEVAAGRPVIVWVVGHVEPGESVVYVAADGRRTMVARFEHTVIVVGYTAEAVTVVDGARTYSRPLDQFLRSWGVLRNMAITAGG